MASQAISARERVEASKAQTTPGSAQQTARHLASSTVTFIVLTTAFVLSAIYQAYRATVMEIPADAFTLTTGLGYAALVGVSALVLTDRRWAWLIVSALVLFFLALGPFHYYPEVATARDMGLIDWLEGSLFMGLITVAGFICTLRMLGAHLVPGRAQRERGD